MATLATQPPPPLEVRCAGCDEILEVEPGLTEFICPDCQTPQALPPELLPRKRKALPLPRPVDSGKAQLPCACCNALLNVPHGLSRFACPKCGADLAVDNERLKRYLAGSSVGGTVGGAAAVAPAAVKLPRPLEVEPHISNDAVACSTMAPVSSTVIAEKVEDKASPTPPTTMSIQSRSKRARNQAGPAAAATFTSFDEAEPSLRRSKRFAKSPAVPDTNKQHSNCKQKKQKKCVSSPGQSPPSQSRMDKTEHAENQLEPQDIARHYNELFSKQILAESPGLQSDPHSNRSADLQLDPDSEPSQDVETVPAETFSDDEEQTYIAEPNCSGNSSKNELDESEPRPALAKALWHAQQRNGSYRKGRESKHRGPTRCLDVWNRPDNDPIIVEFNHLGQPIGKESSTLKYFLGTIARDGELVPLNYADWKSMPADYKNTIWFIAKSKFKLEPIRKKYIIKATGRIWGNWKSVLKRLHYDIHDNDEARLGDIDKRIVPEQWPFLVHFWSSEEGQKRSAIGRNSRKQVKAMHTLGTKSYAQLREEERLKRPNKEEPNRAEMFILTRTRKDGTPVNEESAEIIARLRKELKEDKEDEPSNNTNPQNDVLANVLGKNKGSYKLTYGLLPNKPEFWSSVGPSKEEKERIVAEARRLAEEEAKPLREKIDAMEKRQKEMEEEMERMRNTIALMQNMSSAQQSQPNQPGVPPGFWSDR